MEKIPQFKEVLNVRETAQLLGVHENTVRNLVAKGQLTPTEIPGSTVNRFARKDVMKFMNKNSSGDEGLLTRFRRPGLATATDISIWADEPAARGLFPELIRRLLVASGVRNLTTRTLDQVHSPGWDASCTSPGTTFLPAGELRFEIGTNGDPNKKAQRDYKKRSTGSSGLSDLHYVVVTARIWSNNSTWVNKRNAEGIFKSVSVIDAHEIWQWLEEHPVVHLWFSKELGLNPNGAMQISEWWTQFRSTLKIGLSEDLFLAGREQSVQKLLGFLQTGDNGGQLILESSSASDMHAFLYAVAVKSGVDLEKVIVVNDDDSLARILKASEQLVIVLPDRFDATAMQNLTKHKAILLTDLRSNFSLIPGIHLESIPLDRAIDELKKTVLEDENIFGLALLARKSMPTFLNAISLDPRVTVPAWCNDQKAATAIAFLLLVGRWEPSDAPLLESLTGMDYLEIEDLLSSLSQKSDPPFVAVGGSWRPVYLQNLIALTSSSVSESRLKKVFVEFKDAVEKNNISLTAVSGILRSLVIRIMELEDNGRNLELSYFQEFVSWLTLKSFTHDLDLSTLHPLLAEADPNGYLDLFDDKKFVAEKVSTYFPALEGSNEGKFVSLLWALEQLSRSPLYFSRAGKALAELHALATHVKMTNRPITSLRNICLPHLDFGGIKTSVKIALVQSILEIDPGTGWKLVLELWPSRHKVIFPPHSPIFRNYDSASQTGAQADWLLFENQLVELVKSELISDKSKWPEVIPLLDDLQPDNLAKLLSELEQAATLGFVSKDTNIAVWSRIQTLQQRHQEATGANWVFSKSELARLESILKLVPLEDEPTKYSHLFTWDYEFAVADGDTKQIDLDISKEQRTAIAAIRTKGHFALIDFSSSCERPEKLGRAIAAEVELEKDESALFLQSDEPKALVAILNYFDSKAKVNGLDWLCEVIAELSNMELQKKLVRVIPLNKEGIERVNQLNPELQASFWTQINPYGNAHGDPELVVSKLLEFGNIASAVVVASNQIENSALEAEGVLKVVQQAVDAIDQSMNNDTMASYHLGKLLNFLETSGAETRSLAELEFYLFDDFRNGEANGALYELLNSSPKDLVNLCMLFIDPETKSDFGQRLEPTARARIAYSVYHNWRKFPGATPSGDVDVERFAAWIHGARDEFDRLGKLSLGDEILGQISARCGRGADGLWPADAVRQVVEKLKSESFETGLYIGKANQRGVTTRGVTDGGGQERELSNDYLASATQLELKNSRTSKVIRRLAAKYAREAEFFDADAERISGE